MQDFRVSRWRISEFIYLPVPKFSVPIKKPVGVGVGLLLGSCLVLSSCGGDGEADSAAPKKAAQVTAGTVEMREFVDEVEALGTVRALESIEVSANVMDRISEISFEDGQTVEKGAVLARLSDSEELAVLEGAKINLLEQEREITRLSKLASDGAVSQVRLQEYETARELAMQKIEEANATMADRTVVAPFGGVLGFRRVSLGALVTPGQVLTTLDLIDTVKLDFAVPETFLGNLAAGEKIQATSEAYPNEEIVGEVKSIDSRVDPVTRSVVVRAEIENADHRLKPGMLLTARVLKNPTVSPSVPERALIAVETRRTVFRVAGEGDKTTAESVEVQIGRRVPGYVEILSGLEEGDKIIVDRTPGLRNGAPITVSGEAAPPSAPYNPTRDTGEKEEN